MSECYAARNLIVTKRVQVTNLGTSRVLLDVTNYQGMTFDVSIDLYNGEYNCTCVHGTLWRFNRDSSCNVCYHALASFALLRRLKRRPVLVEEYTRWGDWSKDARARFLFFLNNASWLKDERVIP